MQSPSCARGPAEGKRTAVHGKQTDGMLGDRSDTQLWRRRSGSRAVSCDGWLAPEAQVLWQQLEQARRETQKLCASARLSYIELYGMWAAKASATSRGLALILGRHDSWLRGRAFARRANHRVVAQPLVPAPARYAIAFARCASQSIDRAMNRGNSDCKPRLRADIRTHPVVRWISTACAPWHASRGSQWGRGV